MDAHHPPLTSMKALASVSVRLGDRGAEFPEGIIIDGPNLRLETLNLLYQPMLIIVCSRDVAVLDVRTGACSISSPTLLERYTHMRSDPEEFGKLITGRLIGKPDRMNWTNGERTVSGTLGRTVWTAQLDAALRIRSVSVHTPASRPLVCVYSGYDTFDGVLLPRHITCSSNGSRLTVHYRTVHTNVPVDPSLMDIRRLCGTGLPER